MMQNIATAKSDVAAFATGSEPNSFAEPESNEQFGKILQDQKHLNSLAVVSKNSTPNTSNKKATQQSTDEVNMVPSSGVKESTTTQTKMTTQPVIDESTANNLKGELTVGNTKAELQLISPSKHNDIESKLGVDSASMVAQEWVSLVDSLQKSANVAQLAEHALVDVDMQSLDVSVADFTLADFTLANKIETSSLEQITDNLKVKTDEIKLQPVEDNILAVNLPQLSQVQDDDVLLLNKQANQSLSILIDEAVSEVLSEVQNEGLTESDVRQKTIELLLERPDALQELSSKLQIISQESGTNTTEQKSLDESIDESIDNAINKDFLLANQQIETSGQVDLTLVENKALLRSLLTDTDTDTEQGELLVQDVQVAQVSPSTIPSSTKTDKVTSNIDIHNILNLTENKRNKVFENIAQRIFDSKKTEEPISPEQITQQIIIPKAAEIISSVESSSKDFISVLKSGFEEFKNQLSQGREPGIDLKALVSDALAKTSDKEVVAKTPANLEQIVKSVSQVLDFAQTMNRAIEHHHDQTYSATLKDVAQIQGEQSKQIQLNQFDSKFEKAINLSKSEGHQQLSEKVRWMVNTKNLVAEIRLDPAELGSVNVKVALSGESVTVNFVVQSQQARDAVDTATPKLREMLAEKGIELGQSSVHQESSGQQSQGDNELAHQAGRSQDEFEDTDVPEQVFTQQNIVNGALGGIDYFV